jgi:hypothetical protein
MTRRHRTALLSTALLLAGCSNSDGSTTGLSPVGSLTLTPGSIRLTSGASAVVTCAARDGAGNPVDEFPPVTWLVTDARVALVEDVTAGDRARRRIIGTGIGNGLLGCRYGGITATATVHVVPFLVTVTPSEAVLVPGEARAASASVATEGGTAVPLLNPLRIEWTTSRSDVVRIEASSTPGVTTLRGVAAGTAVISAEVRGFADFGVLGSQSLVVTVVPPP